MILGPDGRPARQAELRREIARPGLASVRQPWMLDAIAPGLTPDALQAVLAAADSNQPRDFLTLAMEMEERPIRYADTLGVRKRAAMGVEIAVESASDKKPDVEAADEIRAIVAAPEIGDAVAGALDGLGKGYSAVEIVWDRSGAQWTPASYHWRDPRWFRWDRADPFRLRLLTDAAPSEGEPLEPGKWIVHVPQLRSGIPARGGLARRAAALYVIGSWALSDWSGWLEIYGRPTRLGRYGPDAKAEDVATLLRALSGLGADNAAAIPDSMAVELLEAARGGTTDAYERLLRWIDESTAILVLGQAATTQGTPGRLGSDEAQDKVRADILAADCKDLGRTLTRDIAAAWVRYNRPGAAVPRIEVAPRDPEDGEALARTLRLLVPLGLRVESSIVRDRLGWPDPPEGAETLQAPASNPNPARAPGSGSAAAAPAGSPLDELEARALGGWQRVMDPMLAPIRELAERARTREEFLAGMADALGEMDDGPLRQALAAATFAARGLGDAGDEA